MKRIGFCLLGLLCIHANTQAQFLNFSPTSDTTAKVIMGGYIDTYFAFDSANPPAANMPYFVSQNRNIETNINLAYISIKYTADRVRATFVPGLGTYMNSNYAAERITLKNIVEANVGVRLFANKNIWLDAGVIGSPYTNESPISFDQPTLTRSFAPEYVPYYMTGARLSIPATNTFTVNLFMLNGWQVIEDINTPLAFGSQFEYKPTDQLTLNLNTYYGYEESSSAPTNRMRSFVDFYALYRLGKLSYTFSGYLGNQQQMDSLDRSTSNMWWQVNGTARYYLTDKLSISARYEHFSDPASVMIVPVTGGQGFITDSYTLGYNVAVTSAVLFRLEGRYFKSPKEVYNHNETFSNNHTVFTAGLTAKF